MTTGILNRLRAMRHRAMEVVVEEPRDNWETLKEKGHPIAICGGCKYRAHGPFMACAVHPIQAPNPCKDYESDG